MQWLREKSAIWQHEYWTRVHISLPCASAACILTNSSCLADLSNKETRGGGCCNVLPKHNRGESINDTESSASRNSIPNLNCHVVKSSRTMPKLASLPGFKRLGGCMVVGSRDTSAACRPPEETHWAMWRDEMRRNKQMSEHHALYATERLLFNTESDFNDSITLWILNRRMYCGIVFNSFDMWPPSKLNNGATVTPMTSVQSIKDVKCNADDHHYATMRGVACHLFSIVALSCKKRGLKASFSFPL